MKHWRIALAGLSSLLLIGFVLVWFLPARWAMPWLAGRLNGLSLQQVSGSLWDGHASQVRSARGEALGQLDWRLSRTALLGERRLQVNLSGPRMAFQGRLDGPGGADAHWTDVHLRADLGLLGERLLAFPIGQPCGGVAVDANEVQLRGGWPLTLDAQLQWSDACLRTPRHGTLPLGVLHLTLRGGNGVIDGRLRDDGKGPLQVDGRLQFSPLGWRFTASASPRDPDAGLRRWLASLGDAGADGVTHIHYSGGLAAAMSRGKP